MTDLHPCEECDNTYPSALAASICPDTCRLDREDRAAGRMFRSNQRFILGYD